MSDNKKVMAGEKGNAGETKKPYETPQLFIHGNIENITKFINRPGAGDAEPGRKSQL